MEIMLKPHVDLYSGVWRALIHPDSQGNWFRSYTAMITRSARLASELNIELLCVGTEFVVATQPSFSSSWRTVLDSIRQYYNGRLTYAANWNGAYAAGIATPEFEQVDFWSQLDYIGIDSYFPLTDSPDEPLPLLSVAIARMQNEAQRIGAVSSRFGKPVIITEVGIQSVHGALSSPWDFSLGKVPGAAQENGVQELYYRVTIDAMGNQPWCIGMFWWNWESIPSTFASTNYTPRNKPAATWLYKWYSGSGVGFALRVRPDNLHSGLVQSERRLHVFAYCGMGLVSGVYLYSPDAECGGVPMAKMNRHLRPKGSEQKAETFSVLDNLYAFSNTFEASPP